MLCRLDCIEHVIKCSMKGYGLINRSWSVIAGKIFNNLFVKLVPPCDGFYLNFMKQSIIYLLGLSPPIHREIKHYPVDIPPPPVTCVE